MLRLSPEQEAEVQGIGERLKSKGRPSLHKTSQIYLLADRQPVVGLDRYAMDVWMQASFADSALRKLVVRYATEVGPVLAIKDLSLPFTPKTHIELTRVSSGDCKVEARGATDPVGFYNAWRFEDSSLWRDGEGTERVTPEESVEEGRKIFNATISFCNQVFLMLEAGSLHLK